MKKEKKIDSDNYVSIEWHDEQVLNLENENRELRRAQKIKICVNNSTKEGELVCSNCRLVSRTVVEFGEFSGGKFRLTEQKRDVLFCPYCGAKVVKRGEIWSVNTLLKYGRSKSLRDTATEMRISYQELHLIENGKVKPKKETIKKICDYFNVDYKGYL